jgi:hypothetical protein
MQACTYTNMSFSLCQGTSYFENTLNYYGFLKSDCLNLIQLKYLVNSVLFRICKCSGEEWQLPKRYDMNSLRKILKLTKNGSTLFLELVGISM